MAKSDEAKELNTEQKKDGLGSKLLTLVIVIIIVLVWLAIFAMMIRFDIGGLGEQARPYLENNKILNKILPPLTDEEIAEINKYPYKSIDEAMAAIKLYEKEVDKLKEENDDYAARQKELQEENDTLRHFEEEYEDFLKTKEDFDKEVVYNDKAPTYEDYIKWYQQMDAETAAKIYADLKAQDAAENEPLQAVASIFAKMKAKDAAVILEEYTSDLDFICDILELQKLSHQSDIMTQLKKDNPTFAARVSEYMAKRKSYELEDR